MARKRGARHCDVGNSLLNEDGLVCRASRRPEGKMAIGEKTERRSGGATLRMLAILGFLVAGCGGGSSSSTPAPSAPAPGLWVPNFFNFDVTAFNARQRAKSGAPDPALRNE